MAQTDNKVPEIRFSGFSAEWKDADYASILSVKHGFAFKGEFFASKGPHIVLTPGNFAEGGGFRYQGSKEKYYTSDEFPKEYILSQGDLVVVMTEQAEGLIGTPLLVLRSGRFLHNQRLGLFVLRSNDSREFLFHQCCTIWSKAAFSNTAAGTKVRHTSPEKIEKLPIRLPEQPEQDKIAGCLTSLDRMIGLHQRKHDKLVTLKQAMLQKIFPQDGATTPEIRFKGFNDPWEVKTLGEVTGISSASRVHKNEWTTSGVPFFRSSDVVAKFKGLPNDKAFISYELFESLSRNSGRLEKGDILITGGGSIGIPYQVPSDAPLYSKDADLLWLKLDGEIDSDFLYTFFSSGMFQKYVKSISHIGTIAHYTVIQANGTPIAVPSIQESERVGTYFRKLNELISSHATQLEKLKNIKSACLEKMFV